MLKIKDNVDLKELEKFGFEHHNLIYVKEIERKDEEICLETNKKIYIEEDNKHISISPDKGYLHFNTDIELDTIYDLIKADLVEKID